MRKCKSNKIACNTWGKETEKMLEFQGKWFKNVDHPVMRIKINVQCTCVIFQGPLESKTFALSIQISNDCQQIAWQLKPGFNFYM